MTHKNVVGEVVCHRKYAQVVQLDGQCQKATNGEKGMDVRTLRVLGVGHGFLRG